MQKILVATGLLLLLVQPQQAARAAEPLPVAPLAATAQFERFFLAPDGRRVVGSVRTQDRRALIVQGVDGSARKLLVALDKPDNEIELLRWVGTAHVLARVTNYKVQGVDGTSYPHSRLMVFAVDGGAGQWLQPDESSNINHLSTEVQQACPAAADVLLQVPLSADEHSVLRFGPRGEYLKDEASSNLSGSKRWWADARGQVRLMALTLDDGSGELWTRPAEAQGAKRQGEWTRWLSVSAVDWPQWQVLGFDADVQQVLIKRPHEDAAALMRVSLDAPGTAVPLQRLALRERVRRLIRHEGDCRAVGLVADATHTWADRLDALLGGLHAALPDYKLSLHQWQGSRYVVKASLLEEPAEYMLGDRAQGSLARSEWPAWALSGRVSMAFTELPGGGTLWHPKGGAKKALPVVVCTACELNADDESARFNPMRAMLLSQGYTVLVPRGWTRLSEVRMSAIHDPLRWIDDALQEAVASGWVDGQRVAIMATNAADAYVGLRWSALRETPPRAVITLGALADLRAYAKEANDDRLDDVSRAVRRDQLGGLKGDALDAASPVHQAARLRSPSLLMHGSRDGRLPIIHSRRLHEALKDAGTPTRFIRFANSDSHLDHPPYRREAMDAVLAWLREHL